jgi:hypothetical protein
MESVDLNDAESGRTGRRPANEDDDGHRNSSIVRRLSSIRFSLAPAPPRPWTHAWYHITISVLGM